MKALRVVGVALLVLIGGTVVAHAARPQAKPIPLVCGASSATEPMTELTLFFSQPVDKAPGTLVRGRCVVTCSLCQSDFDCYFDGIFLGPCGTGFCQ
jgi:hypothetical protein